MKPQLIIYKQCRICLEHTDEFDLFSPCKCNGTARYVHKKCLYRWIDISTNNEAIYKCMECHYSYVKQYYINTLLFTSLLLLNQHRWYVNCIFILFNLCTTYGIYLLFNPYLLNNYNTFFYTDTYEVYILFIGIVFDLFIIIGLFLLTYICADNRQLYLNHQFKQPTNTTLIISLSIISLSIIFLSSYLITIILLCTYIICDSINNYIGYIVFYNKQHLHILEYNHPIIDSTEPTDHLMINIDNNG